MSSPARRQTVNLIQPNAHVDARAEVATTRKKVRLLKDLVLELQRELEPLSQLPTPTVELGLDFYTEVSQFESELIRRALIFAEGHQGVAAQLLNLNTTTLNAMIKRYRIPVDTPPRRE